MFCLRVDLRSGVLDVSLLGVESGFAVDVEGGVAALKPRLFVDSNGGSTDSEGRSTAVGLISTGTVGYVQLRKNQDYRGRISDCLDMDWDHLGMTEPVNGQGCPNKVRDYRLDRRVGWILRMGQCLEQRTDQKC